MRDSREKRNLTASAFHWPKVRLLEISLLPLLISSCSQDHSSPQPRDSLTAAQKQAPIEIQFESIADNAIADGLVEGIQFALVEHGEILSTGGVGLADRETGRQMTPDTPINVASISKPVTAWGLLALMEEETLHPDTPFEELLRDPELYDDVFGDGHVTLRMLLDHTSGLSGASVPVTPISDSVPEIPDILRGRSSVRRARVEQPPGTGFRYSGAGYLVLQLALENRTQRSFAEYMDETVLRAAGMENSTFAVTSDWHDRVAAYYRDDGRRRDPYHLPGAAGGLYSTANDMARFIRLYTEGASPILDPERLSHTVAVDQPSAGISNLRYAFGHYTYVTQEGATVQFHAGGNPGLRALFVVAPDAGHGFFAVANNDRGSEVLAEMLAVWGNHYELSVHSHF